MLLDKKLYIILGSFIVIILYRFIKYQTKLSFLKRLEKDWMEYLKNESASYDSLAERATRLKLLFKEANLGETQTGYTRPMGYGIVLPGGIPVLDNFYLRDNEVVYAFRPRLKEAIGYYKDRRNETFSLLYWIDWIIYLPSKTLSFLGTASKQIKNIIQVIYWILLAVPALYKFLKWFNQL